MRAKTAREALQVWQASLKSNCYASNTDLVHSVEYYFPDNATLRESLHDYAQRVVDDLEEIVAQNDHHDHMPRFESYDALGERQNRVLHSIWYAKAGEIIYGSGLMQRIAEPGHLLQALCFFYLSSHAGEAGHHCPIACSAGLIRVLQHHPNLPHQQAYLDKLTRPSYEENFTGAQFLTEIIGGSDVGANAVYANKQSDGSYAIFGEKWFCSNANADLILMTARYDAEIEGTPGLGLFLVPRCLDDGSPNHYAIRRLKDKIGTRAMASAEIEFNGAVAYAVDPVEEGFKTVMTDVLHLSRLFNTFTVLGMGRRAHQIAYQYARHRCAFGQPIIQYPLVMKHLVTVRVENTALCAGIFATTALQDQHDTAHEVKEDGSLLLRLLANLNKSVSALWSVDHIHHSVDILAGNGAIESFSSLPRLLRDSIVCENWEGAHNALYMQILRDIYKYQVDAVLVSHMKGLLADCAEGNEKDFLSNQVSTLEVALSELKSQNKAQQSLSIQSLCLQMHCLYCSLHLFKEACHQRCSQHSDSKWHQWQYFNALHLNYESVNTNDLELMNSILHL